MSQAETNHDVVIVGGGHNGLVAGCYLAREGLDVLVVEQRPQLGGMTTTAAFVDEAPEHLLSPGAYEDVYLRANGTVEELELARYGYRELDSAGWAWLGDDGESLIFRRSIPQTVREIARFSHADAERYRELAASALKILAIQDRYGRTNPRHPGIGVLIGALRALVGDRRLRTTLGALITSTAADAIASTFESQQLRGAFASIGTILCPPTAEGSAITMLSTSLVHQNGAARPVGGMGGLVDALERCLRAHGGDVSLGTAAVAIHPRSGCAGTVELEDGRLAHAGRAVIAACPPQLVPDLAAELDAAVAERLRSAPANATGVGALTVNLALVGRLELPAHQAHRADFDLRRPTLFHGSFADVIGACEQCARGRLPDTANWCLAILTAIDPSQAPEGQDVAQLYAPAPVAPDGGWAAQRVNAAARLVAAVGVAAPALTELEIGRYVETPSDLSDRTGTINGCLYHVDHLPTRMGPLRPAFGAGGYRTPVPGLYLGSAGSHPGGGVSGLPGKLCALTVLADGRSRSGVRSLWRAPVRHSQKPVTRDSQPRTVPVADNHARHPGDGLATSPH